MKAFSIIIFLVYLSYAPQVHSQALSNSEIYDLLKNGLLINPHLDEIQTKEQFGAPKDIKIEEAPNPYNKNKDVITNYSYPGIEISFYESKNPQNKWKGIVSVIISSRQYQLKYGLRVGMPQKEIEKLFQGRGCKVWESSGLKNFSYSMPGSVHDQIIFVVKDGTVQKIIWSDWP